MKETAKATPDGEGGYHFEFDEKAGAYELTCPVGQCGRTVEAATQHGMAVALVAHLNDQHGGKSQ